MHPSPHKIQSGFTLIELMIVVAIIALIAAIALPQYQNYVVKSQLTRVYGELNMLRSAMEVCYNDGQTTAGSCELDTLRSNLLITDPVVILLPTGSISGTIGDDATVQIQGGLVAINRTETGEWSCDFSGVDVAVHLKPKPCR